jgi:dTDP-4-amino-4,6-dideoxy-D-galactose acyltransferase
MNKQKYVLRELNWDTQYFGVPSCKIILNEPLIKEEDKLEIINYIGKYEFVTFNNVNNNNINNYWLSTNTNAHLVDVNVQFEKKVRNLTAVDSSSEIVNNLKYNDEIIKIASEAFIESRFYNDVYLDKEKAKAIYVEWVKNSFHKHDRYFIVTNHEGKITSFLLFSLNDNNSTAIIELIAVDKAYQNKKYGYELLSRLERFMSINDISILKVGTQINNVNAIRFYTKNGFNLKECHSVYHCWPNKK